MSKFLPRFEKVPEISESSYTRGLISDSAQHIVNRYETESLIEAGQIKKEKEEEPETNKKRESSVPLELFHERNVGESVNIIKMEDFNYSDNPVGLFGSHLKSVSRLSSEVFAATPTVDNSMSYVSGIENNTLPYFFVHITQHATQNGLLIPRLECVSPDYVSVFLRKADPKNIWERPCLPPINPVTNTQFTCESVLMGGPVLREFLLPSQLKKLMESPYFKEKSLQKSISFPSMHRCCFLCSQKLISILYGLNKNLKGGEECTYNYIIHDYIVPVNCPGGYKIELMLSGFKRFVGIAGPVIGHNRLHYEKKMHEGKLEGWVQTDKMLFQDGVTKLQ